MKILITGATGLIGRQLTLQARAAGHAVVAIGQRNNEVEARRGEQLVAAGADLRIGSINDDAFLRDAIATCDTVIHLAAAQHEMNVPDEYFRRINVDGTRTLLQAAVAAGVRRFVHGSTIGVYGSAATGELDENSPTHPDNIYGITKLAAEGVVREFADLLDTRIVRISETYGPGDMRLLKLFRAIEKGTFVMIGPGDNRRQLVHVADLCEGLLLAATTDGQANELFVLAGAEVLTTQDTAAAIAAALDRAPRRWHLPLWPFEVAAALLETTLRPLGIQPPLHRRRLDFFKKSFFFSTAHARQRLGFQPAIRFVDGARETARWYVSQRLLCPRAAVASINDTQSLPPSLKGH